MAGEGFVQLVPRRGFVVAPISQQDIRDLFWTQAQLAAELAARAAKTITPETITRLESIDAEFRNALDSGRQAELADLGHRFHREINLAAGSRPLTLLLGSVVRHLPNRFYASIESQVASSSHSDHPEIVTALRERNTVTFERTRALPMPSTAMTPSAFTALADPVRNNSARMRSLRVRGGTTTRPTTSHPVGRTGSTDNVDGRVLVGRPEIIG